ncbi:hypothetical protein BGZ76_006694 [Entomortierella beljakovae]|nr:hypothetical protein BGZ76_006694 [Entomortierella beljakovae]
MTELVLPSHCDGRGYCLGGTVLSWIDIAAGIAAKKHGVYPAVTRSVDAVHFLGPITTQNIVIIQASVNRAWKTSMEVGVRVMTEDLLTSDQRYVCHAYLTFVALPQAPLQTLKPGAPQRVPSQRGHSHLQQQHQSQQQEQQENSQDVAASKAVLTSSLAARRFSFSLPSAKSKSSGAGKSDSQPVQLPAIEPISPVEMERYTMAQSRREGRLKQARSESREEEDKLLSDVRDRMRRWNVSQKINSGINLDRAVDGQGNRRIAMQSTFAEAAQLVLPQHANSLSITFGGQVMKWMENVAAVSATRLSRLPIVTARKTMIGDCLTMRSVVTRVFRSSMEVYVFVDSENLVTGKQTFTNEAFFSMVAMDPSTPMPMYVSTFASDDQEPKSFFPLLSKRRLPSLVPGDGLEKALSGGGESRRIKRLEQRRELSERELLHSSPTPVIEKRSEIEQHNLVQISSPKDT